jgi:DNA helicase-2/ATP-dependent DNA helicase PcrA
MEDKSDRVSLMTLHNAKGLEFPIVFISGLEEGFIPHSLSLEEGNIEEERRLLYVGITRARETLHLTASRFRNLYGTTQPRLISRFLEEIDPSALERSDTARSVRTPRASNGAGFPSARRREGETFAVGDTVLHETYGEGSVVRAEETPSGQKISIRFGSEDRIRNFLTQYTPIVKIPSGAGNG